LEDKSGSYRALASQRRRIATLCEVLGIADNASQELSRKEAKERIAELTARVRATRGRRR